MRRTALQAGFHALFTGWFVCFGIAPAFGQDWRFRTQLPGVDMAGLDHRQQGMVLQILREEDCPCGCEMKLAQCRVEDQTCPASPSLVKLVTDAARQGHSSMVIRSSLVSQLPPQELNRQISFEAVRQAALAVDLPHVGFAPPMGTDRVYRYDFGPYRDEGLTSRREVPRYRSANSYPVELQRTIESIRKDRSIEFWQPFFVQVEDVVRQQIRLLNRPGGMNKTQLDEQLRALSLRGYQILDGAVHQHANSQGWTARLSVMSGEARGGAGRVRIAISPVGATVYYSSESKFRETAKLGLQAIRDVNSNWQRLGQLAGTRSFELPASGKMRFYAIWPNGMEEMTLVNVQESYSDNNFFVTPVSIQGL